MKISGTSPHLSLSLAGYACAVPDSNMRANEDDKLVKISSEEKSVTTLQDAEKPERTTLLPGGDSSAAMG